MSGDTAAIREVIDRVEGKAVQALEHSGPEGGPIPTIDPAAAQAVDNITAYVLEQGRITDAFEALHAVIEANGIKPLDGSGLRPELPCAHVQEWREKVFARNVLDKDAPGALEHFDRLKYQLQERHYINEKTASFSR